MPQVYGIDPHHKEPQHQYGIELYDKHRQKSIYQSVENITSKYTLCLFINPGQPKTQYDCKDKKIREDPYFVEMCPSQTKGEYAKLPTPHHTTPHHTRNYGCYWKRILFHQNRLHCATPPQLLRSPIYQDGLGKTIKIRGCRGTSR